MVTIVTPPSGPEGVWPAFYKIMIDFDLTTGGYLDTAEYKIFREQVRRAIGKHERAGIGEIRRAMKGNFVDRWFWDAIGSLESDGSIVERTVNRWAISTEPIREQEKRFNNSPITHNKARMPDSASLYGRAAI